MTHEHKFQLNKQIDNSYLLTCSCHDTLTIGQMNRRLAENERMKEYIEETYEEDFVMWCREQDALKEGE